MANFVLPMVAASRRGLPAWVDEQIALGGNLRLIEDAHINTLSDGSVLLAGATENYWSYFPIASQLSENNVEVLVKLTRLKNGIGNYINTGGAISFSGSTGSYACTISSGTASSCAIYDRPKIGSQENLGSVTVTPTINVPSITILIRARRDADNIRIKVWRDGSSEPTAWSLSVKNTSHDITGIDFIVHGRELLLKLRAIAYATNGDTASFDTPTAVDVVAGSVSDVLVGDIINIHDLETHDIVNSIKLPLSGSWTSNLYNNRPVYARLERAIGSEYDLLFAKYGGNYLGGDYPSGALKDDGVPSTGEVSILYRSDDPILGGATIAKVSAAQSGEWRASGLQPNVPFDVVARKPDRKDVLVSGVVSVIDPDFKFILMGGVSHTEGYLKGLLLAKGATPPLTSIFLGLKPYGLEDSAAVPDGNSILINSPMREYGDFDFSIDITDANQNTINNPVSIKSAKRAPFVDLIGFIAPVSQPTASLVISSIVIPSDIMVDDIILLITVQRSESLTVTDSNQGLWQLATTSPRDAANSHYPQWNSIYWRYAKEGDAGANITITKSESSSLFTSLAVFRGKYAKLKIKTPYAFKDKYNSTYNAAISELAPITNTSGFLVRVVSNVYAATGAGALMMFNNLTNLGPTVDATRRMQVGTAHLSDDSVFSGTTYETGSVSNVADSKPDVAIILDEIRP